MGAQTALGYARWTVNTVIVRDHTGVHWEGLGEPALADWTAVLPARAPAFVYVREAAVACAGLTPTAGELLLCEDEPAAQYTGWVQTRHRVTRRGPYRIPWAIVHLNPVFAAEHPEKRRSLLCHELGHAVTAIPDGGRNEDSCVQGWRETPGRFDAAYAQRMYEWQPKKHRGRR